MALSTSSKILVVGVDSMIGRGLMTAYQRSGQAVIGTSRRKDAKTALYLDLADEPENWQISDDVDVAIICAGVTRLADCHRDPVTSAKVNVRGTAALAKKLAERGVFVIYLSSDKVFDGAVPFRQPDDPYSPLTTYGRQKVDAEQAIKALGDSAAVLRLSKVLGADNPLFAGWVNDLKQGKAIKPFSDMYLAPVPLTSVVTVLQLLAAHRLPGIWQLSGERDVSYADAARFAAKMLGKDGRSLKPHSAAESGLLPEPVSRHTTMNSERLVQTFGIIPVPVWWTLEAALFYPEKLAV